MDIFFISPYGYDLDIGGAYNRSIDPLPPKAWICITDQDTLKPPGFAERIGEIIKAWGGPDTLIGCRTNRVGIPGPYLVKGMFMEENITRHLEVARQVWKEEGTDVCLTEVVPGYCMVFNKDLWQSWGGFPANNYRFDIWASQRSPRCLIAQGVYLFHLYRWLQKTPRGFTKHLNVPGYYLN